MAKIKLPATDQSTDNPSHDFIEVEPSRVLCNDVVLPGERNPNHTRLWIVSAAFSNWPTFLGAVWADNEQDALDTLIDEGLGEALLVEGLTGLPSHRGAVALVELEADGTVDGLLGGIHGHLQELPLRGEPEAVIDQLRVARD